MTAAYRCRHGHTTAAASGPERQKNSYVRKDRVLLHLPALYLLLTGPAGEREGGALGRGADRVNPEIRRAAECDAERLLPGRTASATQLSTRR